MKWWATKLKSIDLLNWLSTVSIVTAMLAILHPQTALANTCTPQTTSEFAVTGVALDDTLNVRSGPTTKYPVIAELGPNADGIGYGGDRYFIDWECQALCREATANGNTTTSQLSEQCFQKNKVWFEIITPDSTNGWVSANFLDVIDTQTGATTPQLQQQEERRTTSSLTLDSQEVTNFFISHALLNICARYDYLSSGTKVQIQGAYDRFVSDMPWSPAGLANIEQAFRDNDLVQFYNLAFAQSNNSQNYELQAECNGFTGAFLSHPFVTGR